MENYKKIAKIADEGYDLDFGFVFEKSFDNFKKIWGIAGVSLLVVSIVIGIAMVVLFGVIYGFSNFNESLIGLDPAYMSTPTLLGFIVFASLFSGIFSPINAGFVKMAYLADTNQQFGLDTIFDYFTAKHFKELFVASSSIAFFGTGLAYTLEFFGVQYIGNLVTTVVSFFTILTIPLIIFSDLKAFEAIEMSCKLVAKSPFTILGLLIVGILFMLLGIFAFCIGIIFTMPFLFSLYYIIYRNIIPLEDNEE